MSPYRTSRLIALVVGAILPLFLTSGARADDAEVLPKGVSNAYLGNFFYPFPTTDRFNKHGDTEPIANAFDGRRLDSTVFPTLLGPPLPPGTNIGTSFIKFRYDYNILNFGASYGITDRLAAGIDIPYYYAHNKVKASLDPSGATLGIGAGGAFAFCPCGGPGQPRPVNTDDVQQLLRSRFGFKRVESFTDDGLGDITALFKYQYFRTEDWRLATSLGARFPTGRQDDPDNLADIPWSPGNYAILLRLHNDYVLSNLWKERPAPSGAGPVTRQEGDLVVNFTFRYDWNLPTDVTVRISDASNPITTNKESVTRKLGDKFEFELSGRYYLLKALSFTGLYRYAFKVEDVIRGHRFNTRALEEDTDSNEQLYILGVNYSLLPLYLEKRFPIPLNLSLTYRDRFAGRGTSNAASPSQILKTRYINFTLSVPF